MRKERKRMICCKIVTNLNQRLYYNEMTKRDIGYKTFLEKANRLMDTCEFKERNKNNIKKWNKSLDIKINSSWKYMEFDLR